jgi:hypothetical protein
LKDKKIRKVDKPYHNLHEFLQLSNEYKDYLMVRKLERALDEFKKNEYLMKFGFNVCKNPSITFRRGRSGETLFITKSCQRGDLKWGY